MTPDWIPAIRETGLFDSPPEPVEEADGVLFPGWASRGIWFEWRPGHQSWSLKRSRSSAALSTRAFGWTLPTPS
jgi:hypothetical protein